MVVDQNGENPVSGLISSITPDGLVTMMEGRHGLQDGDTVTFEEVVGLEVNKQEFKVEIKSADTFNIGNVQKLGSYVQGGVFTQVKCPVEYKFVFPFHPVLFNRAFRNPFENLLIIRNL